LPLKTLNMAAIVDGSMECERLSVDLKG
jgi:hypothetical protein